MKLNFPWWKVWAYAEGKAEDTEVLFAFVGLAPGHLQWAALHVHVYSSPSPEDD